MSLRWCLLLSIWERGMHFRITYVKYQKNYILTVLDKKIYSVPWFQTLGRATEAIGTCLGWASGTSTSSSIDGTVACIDILAKFFCIWSAKAQGPTLSTSWVLVDVEVTKAEGVTRFFCFFFLFWDIWRVWTLMEISKMEKNRIFTVYCLCIEIHVLTLVFTTNSHNKLRVYEK